MRKRLIHCLTVFQHEQEIGGVMGVAGSPEDFVFVVLEGFDPRAQISSMAVGIVRNAALGHKENAGKFCSQLLFGVVGIAEAIAFIKGFPVQSTRGSAEMGQFMKGGPIILSG